MSAPPERKRPALGAPGADLCWRADRQAPYTDTGSRATIVGISPAEPGSVKVWSWAPESIVVDLGVFSRQAALSIAAQLLRARPAATLFVQRGVVL